MSTYALESTAVVLGCLLGTAGIVVAMNKLVDKYDEDDSLGVFIALIGCILAAGGLLIGGPLSWFYLHSPSIVHEHCTVTGTHSDTWIPAPINITDGKGNTLGQIPQAPETSYTLQTSCGDFSTDEHYGNTVKDHTYTLTTRMGEVTKITEED